MPSGRRNCRRPRARCGITSLPWTPTARCSCSRISPPPRSTSCEPWDRRPGALGHGNVVARDVGLDMVAAGWTPTVDNYLGRVPKARILEAVREGCGEREAQLIDHLKKGDMAREAERLLADSAWLPEALRLPEIDAISVESDGNGEGEALLQDIDGDGDDHSAPRDGNVVSLPAFLNDDGAEDEAAADDLDTLAAE